MTLRIHLALLLVLTKMANLVDAGQLRPLLDAKSFIFSDVAAAHAHAESSTAIGKIVLTQSFDHFPAQR